MLGRRYLWTGIRRPRASRVVCHSSRCRLFSAPSSAAKPVPSDESRHYFYYIDHQGQLFLHDTIHKNFTSCFKEKDFLDFFLLRVEATPGDSVQSREWPWRSRCGREFNYIQVEENEVPIVYTSLVQENDGDYLTWAGSKRQPFDPSLVCIGLVNGRFYYPLPEWFTTRRNRPVRVLGKERYGLLATRLVLDTIMPSLDRSVEGLFQWKDRSYQLEFIEK
ncbi:hypothetical protein HDV03_001351 [Kappamyces sp. JEL0829]|nr:hypothetical protein HDV03_001351 [Kappamyces sp. JEL0829]